MKHQAEQNPHHPEAQQLLEDPNYFDFFILDIFANEDVDKDTKISWKEFLSFRELPPVHAHEKM